MPFGGRVYSLGKLLVLCAALGATFLLFAGVATRVALRTREVQVPQLAGRSVADAARTLSEVGLTIRVDDLRRPDAKVPQGRVVQQEPAAGVAARRQRSIRVWLSAGPRVTTVADLIGQSERTARMRLEQDGITVSAVTELRSSDYPTGVVVAQDPPATVNASRVTLLVNRGAEGIGYVMPDLVGLESRRTADALRSLGFRVSLATRGAQGVPTGTIISQTPAAGFQVGQGEAISLEVSR
ncbi:MAG: PASTA domain-containing protein [Vicinamibacterales bacterium]